MALLLGIAIAAISGVVTWKEFLKPALAETEHHGDGHGHEENEAAHDKGEEVHGHDHDEKTEGDHTDKHNHGVEEPKKSEAGHDDHGEEEGHDDHSDEGALNLSPEQITASGVEVATVESGTLSNEVSVPGKIVADANRMAEIVPKISGVVVEALKNLGDTVEKDEVMARIESREMAEAVAEFQAASRSAELARVTHNREKTLWEKKVTAEQDYLAAKNAWQEAQIRLDLSREKMKALGYTPSGKENAPRHYELKSPIAGRVVARELTLGEFVDTSHTAYTVADLSILWVETAIAPDDLSFVQEGQEAVVKGADKQDTGKLIFVSPVIDPDTRSAKAIIEIQNADGKWRSGDYATALIATSQQEAAAIVPKEAIQTIEGKPYAFVKTAEGFEKREVMIGRADSQNVEVTSGLKAGESVATSNTFILKAEAGKSEAEHAH